MLHLLIFGFAGCIIALDGSTSLNAQDAPQKPIESAEIPKQQTDAVSPEQPVDPVIGAEVQQALSPLLKALSSTENLRTTVKMTVTSSVGQEIVGKSQGLFQMASQAPNKLSLSAKFDTDNVQFVCDGQELFVQLTAEDYLQLPAPSAFEEMLTSMPVQLGPQPEPMLWLSLAGVNPVKPLMLGLKTCNVVEPSTPVDSKYKSTTVKAVRPEGLIWELTVTTGDKPQPVRLLIDMTEMIRQTNNLQVPEGYSFKIQYDFERWQTDAKIDEELFAFTAPDKANKYESLADYLLREGAMGEHPLLGKPAPTFTARLFEGEEVSFEHDPDGKVIVLDFWATWCAPCVEALPELQELAAKFKEKEVVFYAINVAEMPEAISEFLKSHELKVPVIVDPEGQLSAAYAATAIPQTVLIGKGGRVEAVHVGFDGGDSMSILESEIETLLAGRRIYQAKEEVLDVDGKDQEMDEVEESAESGKSNEKESEN